MVNSVVVYGNRLKFVTSKDFVILTGYKTAEVVGDFVYSLLSGRERRIFYSFSKGNFQVDYTKDRVVFTFLSGVLEGEVFEVDTFRFIEFVDALKHSFEDMYVGPFYLSVEGLSFYSEPVKNSFALFMFLYNAIRSKRFKVGFKDKKTYFWVDTFKFYNASGTFELFPYMAGRLVAYLPHFFHRSRVGLK